MNIADKYRQADPREEMNLYCACHADPVLFTPDFEELPEELQTAFNTGSLKIPCEGGGVPGEWCGDCTFGVTEHMET